MSGLPGLPALRSLEISSRGGMLRKRAWCNLFILRLHEITQLDYRGLPSLGLRSVTIYIA